MLIKLLLASIVLAIAFPVVAQQLPANTCGIVNIYDAAGNRTKRVYFCNLGIDPYPTKKADQQAGVTEEFQSVDALYPNPTTGKFFIEFSKTLNNVDVYIIDVSGKMIMRSKGNGNKLDFDLSNVAAGVYFVRITDGKNVVTKKVIKQ